MEYKYSAFISYSNKDLRTASKLKRRLRRFWLPSFMKSDLMGKRLSVFMADKDFNEHTVIDGLHKKLDESEFLVIVCSPDSAASTYCDEEVSYFIKTGRSDKIIPFIISGKANSGDERTECYPRALREMPREEQISGIQTTVVGQYAGYLMTVARIMGLEYDSVKYEVFRRNLIGAVVLAALSIPVIGAGIWAVGYYGPRYEYFADYVDRNGILEGVVPVDRERRLHMPGHYKFEYRRKRLARVTYENSYGTPIEHGSTEMVDRSSQKEFQYNSRGGVEILCRNATGQVLWVETVSPNRSFVGLKDCETDFGKAVTHSLSDISTNAGSQALGFNVQQIQRNAQSTIRGYAVTRDPDGYVLKKMFSSSSDNTSSPGHDANGIAGLEYGLDSLHRIETVTYLDEKGNRTSDHNNVSLKRYHYDDMGNIYRSECFDEDGNPACNENFWATAVVQFNEYSQPECQWAYDEEDSLSMDQFGIAVIRYKWDDRGMRMEVAGFDDKDEPVNTQPHKLGVPVAHRYCYQYNKEGRVSELRCYDKEGRLIPNGETAYLSYEYDRNGNLVKQTCRDENGAVTYGWNAAASIEIEYIDNLPSSVSYRDVEGNLTNTTFGYAYVLQGFKMGRLVREEYFGKKLSNVRVPVSHLGNACGILVEYDDNTGNMTKMTYLGPDGKPARNDQGMEVVLCKFNSRGLCEEMRNESSSGSLYCVKKYEYDEKGNMVRESYYNEAGVLALYPGDACASVEMVYNDAGLVVEQRTLGVNSELVMNAQGWSIARYAYAKGQPYPISISYFGTNDEPIVAEGVGCHEYRNVIKRGQIIEMACYGTNGAPMLNTRAQAWKVTMDYSPMGHLLRITLFDLEGNRVNGPDGYCEKRMEYDSRGWMTSSEFYDASGKRTRSRSQGFSGQKSEYYFNGLLKKASYYDEYDAPLNGPQGYHSVEFFIDSHLDTYRIEYRNSRKHLVDNSSSGFAAWECVYDPNGDSVYYTKYLEGSGENYNGRVLLDTLGIQFVDFYCYFGVINYYYNEKNNTVIRVDEDVQLKAAIEKKIRFYKERYARQEGIEYLFD